MGLSRRTCALVVLLCCVGCLTSRLATAQVLVGAAVDNIFPVRGNVLTVYVTATQVDTLPHALYGAGLQLRYDPAVLDFQALDPDPLVFAPGILRFQRAEPDSGRVSFSFSKTYGAGFSNSMGVCQVRLRVRSSAPGGLSSLRLQKVAAVAKDGSSLLTSTQDAGIILLGNPSSVPANTPLAQAELGRAVPNPVVASTRVELTLPTESSVETFVIDIAGRRTHLSSERRTLPAGRHQLSVDCSTLRPGNYSIVCRVNGTSLRRAIVRL